MEELDLISSAEAVAPEAEYGAGAAGDYLMGTAAPAAAGVASDYAAGPMFSGIPSGGGTPPGGGGGVSLDSVTNAIKPYAMPAASMIYGANSQNKMMKGLNQAQGQSYDQYLNALNPPEATKQAMFNKVNSQILSSAPVMMRKVSNELASRGVRGQGTAAPIAGAQRGVTDAQRGAYLDIYGKYNVPQVTPPVNYAPGTSNLIGKNVSDIGSLMMLKKMFA